MNYPDTYSKEEQHEMDRQYDILLEAWKGEKKDADIELVRKFINAKSEKEIVFTSGTTDSLNKIILAERIPVIGTFRSIGASRTKMNLILILENALYGVFAGLFGSILGIYLNGFTSSAFITTNGVDLSKNSVSITPKVVLIGIIFAVLLLIGLGVLIKGLFNKHS